MAISVDWPPKIITVPKADTVLVDIGPPEIRSFSVDTLRLALKDLEDEFIGGIYSDDTHSHNPPVTVGGVTLARVVEIINGYTLTFGNGVYAVNLEGGNNNIVDVLNLNSVQVRSNNSAGLTYSKQVEDQSFLDNRIYINVANGQPGTAFPIGTPGTPVNNLKDAQIIISNRTLPKKLHITGGLVIGAQEDISDYNVQGAGSIRLSQINFTAGCVTTDAVFFGIDLKGTQLGRIIGFERCVGTDLIAFEGALVDSGISGTITIVDTDGFDLVGLINCFSLTSTGVAPIIDCNALVDLDLLIKGYRGLLTLKNISDASMNVDIDSDSIFLTLDSTCTAGKITVRGLGIIIDNSAGTTVNTDGFVEAERIRATDRVVRNKYIINRVTGMIDVYSDDGLAVIDSVPIFEDQDAITPVGSTITRIDRREKINI